MKIHKEYRSNALSPKVKKDCAAIYRKGMTPAVDKSGRVSGLNIAPLEPMPTASALRELLRQSGRAPAVSALQDLQSTRGNQFVARMLEVDNQVRGLLPTATTPAVPAAVQNTLHSTGSGRQLRLEERRLFRDSLGDHAENVRVHDDPLAHEAATSVNAKAFTVGRRIFFGQGQYRPDKPAGRELLAHEVAHSYQQRSASMPSFDKLTVSSPNDRHERQADSWARSVSRASLANDGEKAEDEPAFAGDRVAVGSLSRACIQRVISFTTTNNRPTTSNTEVNETAAGFRFQSIIPTETFRWAPSVTIRGDPGDPFADWETAHHQVVKSFWGNVWWGTGANRTRRRWFINTPLPLRDATAAGNTWYSDWRAQSFNADGDVRSPVMRDGPRPILRQPWANPAGNPGTRGWFNYGVGFVSTLSARHVPTGTGAAAFRHLNHMHWNTSIAGNFNTGNPVGARATVTSGGPVNFSPMFSGFDRANRPMHGTPLAITRLRMVQT